MVAYKATFATFAKYMHKYPYSSHYSRESRYNAWKPVFLQLYIQLDHVIDPILNKVRKDDIRFVTGR